MTYTTYKNGRPATQDERWGAIQADQRIRSKHLTDEVYQEAEDGAGWVLAEAKRKAEDEIGRWRAANGMTTILE